MLLATAAPADTDISNAFAAGKIRANFNVRYEGVDQDNALQDASGLTLRTRLGYETGRLNGFSVMLEFEDSRIVFDQDDFTVGPTGFNPGQYSVIADPETTELDQGYLQYQGVGNAVTVKLGRQVIALDGQRFIGHVGWRQDRQTFDAATIHYTPRKGLNLTYGYINQRNRIFAEDADMDSKDHLLNGSYVTPLGTVKAYAYLLESDSVTENALDTFGVMFFGSTAIDKVSLLYAFELATQESTIGATNFDAEYLLAEVGAEFPRVTVKLGYELLGSDGGNYGFSTPLATLHKFNGWADQFLATPTVGLEDLYLSVNGKLQEFEWQLVYHDFEADSPATDLGEEVNLLVTRKFAERYTVGLKYAAYDAGDVTSGKVDTDKLWVWLNVTF